MLDQLRRGICPVVHTFGFHSATRAIEVRAQKCPTGWNSALGTRIRGNLLVRGGRIWGLDQEFAGAHDKAVRGCAEVVKRKASDESESPAVRRVQDYDVAGGNDLSGFDKVLKIACRRFDADCVAQP